MDVTNFWVPLIFALLGLGWLATVNFWLFAWSRSDVQHWMDEQGYRLIHWHRSYFFIGQPVYRITVEDRSGQKHTGLITAPSVIASFFGLHRQPKVHWLD